MLTPLNAMRVRARLMSIKMDLEAIMMECQRDTEEFSLFVDLKEATKFLGNASEGLKRREEPQVPGATI